MNTADDVFNWAESLMDAAEDTRGGYRPFVSLEARERERGVAERIIVNERLRQQFDREQTALNMHAVHCTMPGCFVCKYQAFLGDARRALGEHV